MFDRKNIASVLLVVTMFFACLPAQASKSKWSDYKQQGQQNELTQNYRLAEQFYRKSLDEAFVLGANSNEMAESLVRLAAVIVVQGKMTQAEPYYLRLIKMVEAKKKDGTLDDEVLVWMEDLAEDYGTFTKGDEHLAGLQHAIKLRELVSGDDAPYMSISLRELSNLYLHRNMNAEAEPYAVRLVRIGQRKKSKKPQDKLFLATDLFVLGLLKYRLGDYVKAESYTRQAMSLITTLEIPPGQYTVNCQIQLSQILRSSNEFKLAEESITKALQILERTKGKKSLETVPAREEYALVLGFEKKYPQCIQVYEELIAILEAKPGEVDVRLIPDLQLFKNICKKANQSAKASAVEKKIGMYTARVKKEQSAIRH